MIQAAQLQVFTAAAKAPEDGKKQSGEKTAEFSDVLNQTLVGTKDKAGQGNEGKAAGKEASKPEQEETDGTELTNLQALLGRTPVPAMMFMCGPISGNLPAEGAQAPVLSKEQAPAHQICLGGMETVIAPQTEAKGAPGTLRSLLTADIPAQTPSSAEHSENTVTRTAFQEIIREAGTDSGKAEISVSADAAEKAAFIPAEQGSTITSAAHGAETKPETEIEGAQLPEAVMQDLKRAAPAETRHQEHTTAVSEKAEPVLIVKSGPVASGEKDGSVVSEKAPEERLRPEVITVSAAHQKVEAGTGTGVYADAVAKAEKQPVQQTDKVFAQVAQKAVQTVRENGSGDYVFDMKLFPEGLGKVEVRMVCRGENLSLTVTAHHGEAGRLLSDQTEQLKAALSEHYQVTELNIRTDVKTEISDAMAFLSGGFGMARHDGGGRYSGGLHPYTGQETEPESEPAAEVRMGILNAKV